MALGLREKLAAFDPELPLERARTIPSSWYFDPEIHAAECRSIFGSSWLMAGRVDQVRDPGSYLTATLAGEPILVVRDGEGELRAFFNVCRHRAAAIMTETQGKATKLRCRYHGWTYDLAGRLRGVPEFDGVAEFCREEQGLVELAVATWGPIVWDNQNPRDTLAAFFLPLPGHRSTKELGALRFVERREYELACNWKVFVDNYLDGGYHINTVHPGLAGVIDYSQYRTEIAGNTSVQIGPLKPPERSDAAVGQVRTGEAAYYWWVFPNFMMNIYAGVMDTNLVLPLGPERCRVLFDFYFADTDGPEAQRFIANSIAVAHQVQLEDQGVCEEVQRGLASRSFHAGRFSVKREGAGYEFHRLLAVRLRRGLD
jgi:choline monooxygenase